MSERCALRLARESSRQTPRLEEARTAIDERSIRIRESCRWSLSTYPRELCVRWTTGWDCTTAEPDGAKVGRRNPENPTSAVVLLKPFRVDPGEALWLLPSRAVDYTLSINKPKERLIVRRAECGLVRWQVEGDSFHERRCRPLVTVACNKEQPENALQNAEEKPWGHGRRLPRRSPYIIRNSATLPPRSLPQGQVWPPLIRTSDTLPRL
jgi:hypothetical protein